MNRRPLGRGLDALIPSSAEESNGGLAEPAAVLELGGIGFQLITPDRIRAGRFQPRQQFDQGRLEELAAAIRAQGIIEPLIVRPDGDGYELIAGERRLRAARLAELTVVPVIVRELDDRAALEMSLVENLLREDLNPIEEGQAFARLNRDFALTHDEIATRIGKSRSYVSNIIRLIELPPEVLAMIGRGELTGGQVRPLLALSSPEAQLAEARKIAESKISSRQAEAIASARRGPRTGRAAARTDDPNLLALGETIQRALKRKVRIVRRRGPRPGRIELEFYNDEDLSSLARTLSAANRAISQISE
jgi:ParB family chromosome partitioning protein